MVTGQVKGSSGSVRSKGAEHEAADSTGNRKIMTSWVRSQVHRAMKRTKVR